MVKIILSFFSTDQKRTISDERAFLKLRSFLIKILGTQLGLQNIFILERIAKWWTIARSTARCVRKGISRGRRDVKQEVYRTLADFEITFTLGLFGETLEEEGVQCNEQIYF